MFPGKEINVPVILQGPSTYTSADESEDLSDVASQMGTCRVFLRQDALIMWLCLQVRVQLHYRHHGSKNPLLLYSIA